MAKKLQDIFEHAIGLERTQREGYLASACGADAALRAEVEALLRAHDGAAKFLASPTAALLDDAMPTAESSPAAATFADPLREGPGTRIGPYKILQLIGEGGFGSVFMAEQEKPVSRKVALKIIKLGMDTGQVVARFEQERQALAMMDHPSIAKVLDAGATETGRPFFVMELVKGDPIAEYADKQNMSIDARLELFAQVCNAVQHAHTKGIIHRDIKPSNVLVSTQDGKPHAKVIDFGIAKATLSKLTERTLFTEHRQLIGTPEYMSPEQAEGSLDIDTRTDVYSLGVLLYELLTGTTPFTSQELRSAAYVEIQRIIREVEPPKPSTRLSNNAETLANVAARRQIEPKRLGTLVRGELDWIVMKALEKDRHRRYETPSGLAMDVRRYLAREPVMAAPPSRVYAMRKFVRRNRVAVIATSLVAGALVLGIIGTSYGLIWAMHERDLATAEASRASALNTFMQEMILSVNPENRGDRNVTVADMLSKASETADKSLADQLVAEGEARTFLAHALRSIGKTSEAMKEAERGLAIREAGAERNTLQHAQSLRVVALNLFTQGKFKESLARSEQVLAILKSLDGNQRELARAYFDVANAQSRLGQFDDAAKTLDAGEPVVTSLVPARPDMWADFLAVRAQIAQHGANDLAKAEAIALERIAIQKQVNSGFGTADALNDLAVIKMTKGDIDGAIVTYEECLASMVAYVGENHQRIAVIRENLANAYFRQKKYDQVLLTLDQVLAIRIKLFGTDSFPVARTRFNMGVVANTTGDSARSLGLIDGALTTFRRELGENHREVAQALTSRAAALKGLARLDEALATANSALEILQTAPPIDQNRLRVQADIVELLCLTGKPQEAGSLAKEIIAALDAAKPEQDRWIKRIGDILAKCGPAAPTPSPSPAGAP